MFAAQRAFNVFNHLQSNLFNNEPEQLVDFTTQTHFRNDPLEMLKKKMPSSAEKTKKGKGKNDDDNNNGGGGLLEPIIEDLKKWIGKRR